MSDPVATAVGSWRDDPAWPDVDVVMPILNEAEHLADALAAIRQQEYPGRFRVFMAIGPSDDGTEQVAGSLADVDSDLTVIDNPTGTTPAALNLAIRAGRAPIVVRVDGHSQLSRGYVQQAVATLRRTGAANVGGMQVPTPTTRFERAVAAATTSWLGTGGTSYRTGGVEAEVDTVYLGVFDRAAIEDVGLFDERLIRNQDYELNIRLRQSGRTVVFDPELSVGYTPRSSWRSLTRQYYEYGWWKATVIRLHGRSTKLRQVVPPFAILGIAMSAVLACKWRPFALGPAVYLGAVSATARTSPQPLRTGAVLVIVHCSWVVGLLGGAFRSVRSL